MIWMAATAFQIQKIPLPLKLLTIWSSSAVLAAQGSSSAVLAAEETVLSLVHEEGAFFGVSVHCGKAFYPREHSAR